MFNRTKKVLKVWKTRLESHTGFSQHEESQNFQNLHIREHLLGSCNATSW